LLGLVDLSLSAADILYFVYSAAGLVTLLPRPTTCYADTAQGGQ